MALSRERSRHHENGINGKIQNVLGILKEATQEKREELMEFMDEAQKEAVHKVKEAAKTVDRAAHKKPWHFVGGAALGGLLVGLIARLRR